jgi:NAD(P)-dependent dehydrogenase (short-subunit alcohol dehydrogenase family)
VASRDESKATAAIFELESGNIAPSAGRLEFLKLDLLDLRGVKKAAENILLREGRLDILGACTRVYIATAYKVRI